MQCPACFSTALVPTEEGKLLCDECGEEFSGYREEDVDFALAGTAVSNRQSSSSHARAIRDKIQARSASSASEATARAAEPFHDDELLVCEGAFLLCNAIVTRLVELRYAHERIKIAMFELLTHWIERRAALPQPKGVVKDQFKPTHLLSLVALAALYVRSPMLPRDLLRLVLTRQVPFLEAWTTFPQHLQESPRVKEVFTPVLIPTVRQIVEPANSYALDDHAWPPIQQFFNSQTAFKKQVQHTGIVESSFPVGHMHLTLLRLSRLLGLPDEFGARVLRFRELREVATKMARKLNGSAKGVLDQSSLDTVDLNFFPEGCDAHAVFAKPIAAFADYSGYPTDESIQIDFINTMRLCYGRSKTKRAPSLRDRQLQVEWEKSKDYMQTWLRYGCAEDSDTVTWASLTPNVLSSTRGVELTRYARIVDDMLTSRRDSIPEFWGTFATTFRRMSAEIGEGNSGAVSSQEVQAHRSRQSCVYIDDGCEDPVVEPDEGHSAMDEECGLDPDNGTVLLRDPLRSNEALHFGVGAERAQQKRRHELQAIRNGKKRLRLKKDGTDLRRGIGTDANRRFAHSEAGNAAGNLDTLFVQAMLSPHPSGSCQNARNGLSINVSSRDTERLTEERSMKEHPDSPSGLNVVCELGKSVSHCNTPASDKTGLKPSVLESPLRKGRTGRKDFLLEPAGIGLAWTVVRRFFIGSSIRVEHDDVMEGTGLNSRRFRSALDQGIRVVLLYAMFLEDS